MGIKKSLSFTLIEVVVVIGVIGLVLPALFTIVFAILQQQTKIIRLQEVKKQGDFILGTIKTEIKNSAISIHSGQPPTDLNKVCQTTSVEVAAYFKDRNGYWFRFYLSEGTKIASESASGLSDLTNDKVLINSFSINCYKPGDYSPAIVDIKYELCYNNGAVCTSSRPEENAILTYQTKIKLRVIDF